jgi:outer membrane protein TolC
MLAQISIVVPSEVPVSGRTALNSSSGTSTVLPSFNQQSSPFLGSVPAGQATPGVIDLPLADAIDRGLKYNLGLVLSQQGTEQARASRLKALADLLPTVSARVAESVQQINLQALGLKSANAFGLSSPIIGPFGIFDARASFSESLSFKSLNNFRAAVQNVHASEFSLQDARELVVLVAGGSYIEATASASRIDAIKAQVDTAQALYQQTLDMKQAGTVAGIDVLRAQVELQVQQQQLLAVNNDFEKQKLRLARIIGLPVAQQFRLADPIPFSPAPTLTFEAALETAYKSRADYQARLSLKRAAELARKAAVGERLPSIQLNADYGTIGPTLGNSHSTFLAAAGLSIPIFQGGRTKADIEQADALLRQREAEAEDMRGRVEFEVRSAFLDISSATQQVEVARSSVELAKRQVDEARDRYAAGVTNNVEVIQAQQALAVTNENYVSSLFAHNLAKLQLAHSIGITERAVRQFLGGTR